jgi:hypothetical protein
MALTRATRYILSDRVIGYERRDYEAIGAAFKINAVVAATKPELDPEWSVKALNGAKEESEKATSGGVKDAVPELRFAPTKKRGPGQVLKLHVSARDMLESGDEPNFGWVDPPRPLPKAAQREAMQRAFDWKRRQPKIVVDEYDVDPRTGRRIESSRQGIEVKALGRSLGSLVPGGNLGRRAARALNLIVDADGKFRCPPGTPAANQFTDEFGTNCFKPPASARRGLGRLRQWYDWHVRNGLVLQGFTEDSPEFAQNRRAMAEASQMRASDAVFEEQKRLTQEAIHSLMDMVGASQVTTDNEHLWDTLLRMKKNGMWDLEFEGLFRDLYGGDVWDDTKSVQENLTALNQRLFDQYFDTMDPNLPLDERNALAKELVNRHHDVLGGYMDSLLREYYENPEVMKQLKSLETEIPVGDNIEGFWEHEARMIPLAVGQDGFGLSMEVNVVAQVLRPFIKDGDGRLFPNTLGDDGKIRIMRTDGTGTEAQQWAALQAAFRNEMDLERWREVYANDLTAARHQSLRAQAQHIGHHEIAHLMQYDAANKAIIQEWNQKGVVFIEQNGVPVAVTENPLDWDNETWGAAVDTLMKRSLPDDYLPEGFPPVGIHAFEGSMLHILSGKYYQDMVQTYWGANGGTPLAYTEEGRIQLSIMLMEGMAELRALQKMGIVDSEVIDRHLEWLNDRTPPPQPPTSLATPRWSPQGPDNQAVLPPTPRTPDPSAPPGGKPPSSTPLPEGPGGASMPTGTNGDWLETDMDDWEWVPGFPVGYWVRKPPKGPRRPTEDSSPAEVLAYEESTGDTSMGSKARRLFSKIFGFNDTALSRRKRQDLDEQFETMRDRAEELIRLNNERKRTASRESELGLTPSEEAELYAAIVGMRMIAAENDRRRKLSVGQQRARRQKGDEVMPGKYGDESFNRQYELLLKNYEGIEGNVRRRYGIGYEVIDRDALDRMTEPPDRERQDPNTFTYGSDLPSVVPAPGRSDWSREPWSPSGEGDGRLMRGTLTGDRSMVSKGPETMATIREIDASTTKDDVYAIVDPDTAFTPDGFVAVKVPSDLDLAIAEGDTDQTIIFLPKGSQAVSTDKEGPRRNLLLPPGDYETMNVDANNNRTLNVTGQDTSSSYARRLRDALDAMPQPKTVKEHRERENLRRVLDAEIKPEARHSTSPFSSDNAVRTRMVHRRNHLDRSFRERRIEPFSLDSRSRNTERDVNAASELFEMTDNFESMFGEGIGFSLADGTRIPMAPEVEEFVRGRDGSEIRRTLEQATNSWHQGLDRRPRTRVTRDEILSLLSDGSIERPSSALSRELDADMGWPLDAPDRSRPFFGHLTHGVHEDIVNDAINALDRNGYPLRRRGEFFDHSGDSPHGSDLSIFGDIDLIMRPEVSMRTAYGVDDIRTAAPSPTLLNEPSSRVVAGHLSISRRGRGESASQINNFLNAQLTGDFTGIQNRQDDVNWKIQAAIAGGFNLGDIERVDVPINTLDWRNSFINPRDIDIVDESSRTFGLLSRAGWQKDEIEFLRDSIAANMVVDLKSANLLRQHRTAASDKRRFDQAGLSVRYTNPDSVDLFAKGDLSSQTASGMRIGRVRDVEDALRLQMIDEIGARQSTLRPIVQEGMRSMRDRVSSVLGDRIAQQAAERIGRAADRLPQGSGSPNSRGAIAARIIGSKRVAKIMRDAGLDDENIEIVQLVGEMAAAFSGAGPVGVGAVLARRAGRDGIDAGVRKAVEQGWLSEDQAQKILSAADRVAPEGLPDAVNEALGDAADKVVESGAADKARALSDAAIERVRELSLGDRVSRVREKLGERELPASVANTFGFRSERVSKMKQALSVFDVFSLPKADDGNPDYRSVASSTYAWTGAPDSLDQIPLQRIYDALGEDFMVNGRPLKDLMVETKYDTTQYFRLPDTFSSDVDSWFDDDVETDFDKLRAAISDLPDEELRERLLDDLDTARTIKDLSFDLKNALPEGKRGGPPPRNPSAAPAVAEVPPPEEVQAKIDEVLDGLPDGFAEKFARLQEQQLELKDAVRQRKEVQEQVVSDLQSLEQGVGSGLEGNRTVNTPGAADKDKTAEVGNATRVKNPDIDVADHEPVEGENRGHAEIDKLAVQAHQIADSLVSPEHRDELADLLRNDPTMVAALQSLMKRRQDMMESFGGAQLEYDQSDKTGSGYAGRELIEALIEVRGFDGKNLRVTEEELEQVIYVSGAVPLSRGGNPEMQRRHIENEDLPIGEGVDGAGLYFAVDPEGAPPQFQLDSGHDAAGYAGENGGIIQGAISPSANMTTVNAMNNAVNNYRDEMDAPGSANDHPLVELRREWASNPETADLVESLDMMLGNTSSDNAGEYNNAVSAAALLLGYDGMNAYDGMGYDNRVVLLNRTAMIVSNKILSKDDFIAKRPWDKLTERAAAIAESLDVPIGLQGEERTQYILNETARRLEALNGA